MLVITLQFISEFLAICAWYLSKPLSPKHHGSSVICYKNKLFISSVGRLKIKDMIFTWATLKFQKPEGKKCYP